MQGLETGRCKPCYPVSTEHSTTVLPPDWPECSGLIHYSPISGWWGGGQSSSVTFHNFPCGCYSHHGRCPGLSRTPRNNFRFTPDSGPCRHRTLNAQPPVPDFFTHKLRQLPFNVMARCTERCIMGNVLMTVRSVVQLMRQSVCGLLHKRFIKIIKIKKRPNVRILHFI